MATPKGIRWVMSSYMEMLFGCSGIAIGALAIEFLHPVVGAYQL